MHRGIKSVLIVGGGCILLASSLFLVPISDRPTVSLQSVAAEEGAIIQLHTWSFNEIKKQIPEIAKAGFKSIQTSPIQPHKKGNEWWILYQPIDQVIGDNLLGTKEEFEAMCEEAERYGIDVIVDAVLNHMGNNGGGEQAGIRSEEVAERWQHDEFYHGVGVNFDWDYNNRMRTTQGDIGLPDLNTHHDEVQQRSRDFLQECIDAGADGFRFDAVKHIETNIGADEGEPWAGDFWDVVLEGMVDNEAIFLYGEALDQPNNNADNIEAYATFMHVTDHHYGARLRAAVESSSLKSAEKWRVTLPEDTRVAYVENHDNYEHDESRDMEENDRIMAWALLAARDDVTPMYLARPGQGVGDMGSLDFTNPKVAAANWFHNAMANQDELLSYHNNNSCMQIDRGVIGVAFVNTGEGFDLVEVPTQLMDGKYTDTAGSGEHYKVKDGYISGYVPAATPVFLHQSKVDLLISKSIK